MNRILLIGNGFDLAHNLKAKKVYDEYIEHWKRKMNKSFTIISIGR
jgi:hypothetical protein